MKLEPPEADQLEVSVFGPGFGESLCVHLGDGKWMTVDSCLDPATGSPWALGYLTSLGVDVASAVRVVLVTHFDDDHIRGIAVLAKAAASAQIVCSSAINRKDVLQFVVEQEQAAGGIGSGVDELRSLLRLAAGRNGVVWAKANLPLYPRPPAEGPRVTALSPSEDAVERSLEFMALGATDPHAKPAVVRRYRAPDGPNVASVVAQVDAPAASVLLGADLENTENSETGWAAVLKYAKPQDGASLLKVAHHASAGAHHDDVWTEMLLDGVVAVVTPWAKGASFLPKESDLDRLYARCGRVYVTSVPSFRRARRDHRVERLVKRLHGGDIRELVGSGHVRARRRSGESDWSVALAGDARLLLPTGT